jgi:hypothetical protein
MEIPDLTFMLHINCEGTQVYSWFRDEWTDLGIEWNDGWGGESNANWVELDSNYGFDPEKINAEDGWFYYPYSLLVATKIRPRVTVEEYEAQRTFASELIARLKAKGCDVVFMGWLDLDTEQ